MAAGRKNIAVPFPEHGTAVEVCVYWSLEQNQTGLHLVTLYIRYCLHAEQLPLLATDLLGFWWWHAECVYVDTLPVIARLCMQRIIAEVNSNSKQHLFH